MVHAKGRSETRSAALVFYGNVFNALYPFFLATYVQPASVQTEQFKSTLLEYATPDNTMWRRRHGTRIFTAAASDCIVF